MSFPFQSNNVTMRQRILIAIGAGGLAGIGCGTSTMQAGGNGDGSSATDAATMTKMMEMIDMVEMTKPHDDSPVDSPPIDDPPVEMPVAPVTCESGVPASETCYTREVMESKARFGCGQIAIDPEPTASEIAAAFLDNGCLPKGMACDGCCAPSVAPGVPMADGSCCYYYCVSSCCGRPLLVQGVARLADVVPCADWSGATTADFELPSDPALRQRIGDAWLQDARMEHASVASFARFGLELVAFGAPAELVERAQRAARDEVAHARDCFTLAQRYCGVARGPGRLDLSDVRPATSLRQSVRAALLEGCVGETQAAALATMALQHVSDPAARTVLRRIAEDEAQHAELAWRYVAWALEHDDSLHDEVERALSTIAAARADVTETEPVEVLAELHAAGRLSTAEQLNQMTAVLRDVVLPCADALCRGRGKRIGDQIAAHPPNTV